MDRNEILATIRNLANSQGMYGRLLNMLLRARKECPDAYEEYMEGLEAQRFGDAVDLVLYFEC